MVYLGAHNRLKVLSLLLLQELRQTEVVGTEELFSHNLGFMS
jgi:hypothetical protein